MSLPSSLLNVVSGHPCLTGCFKNDPATLICTDPSLPLAPTLQAVCSDCLSFRVGAALSALPPGTTSRGLSDALTAHVQKQRGFVWSTSCYTNAGGFWISAAYYGRGLFLVDASRNGSQTTDLDVLIRAFRLGVVAPEDPRMLVSGLYTSEVVYLDLRRPISPVRSKQDLLASPQCRSVPTQGYQRATVLEFVPLARNHMVTPSAMVVAPAPATPARSSRPSPRPIARYASATATTSAAPATSAPATSASATCSASAGAAHEPAANVCPRCRAEIKERPLFSGTFVGCLC